jgi:hypothetical protein
MMKLLLELLLLPMPIGYSKVIVVFLICISITRCYRVTLRIALVLRLSLILLIIVVETCPSISTFIVVLGCCIIVVAVMMILLVFVRIRCTLVIGIVRVFPFNNDCLILILGNSFLHNVFQRTPHLIHLTKLIFN